MWLCVLEGGCGYVFSERRVVRALLVHGARRTVMWWSVGKTGVSVGSVCVCCCRSFDK